MFLEPTVAEIEKSLAKLEFILNVEAKKLKVYSTFIDILFDAGALW